MQPPARQRGMELTSLLGHANFPWLWENAHFLQPDQTRFSYSIFCFLPFSRAPCPQMCVLGLTSLLSVPDEQLPPEIRAGMPQVGP